MKSLIAKLTVLGMLVAVGIVATGCQAPGRLLGTAESEACPTCRTETRTARITGLTYTKHVCPACKDVSTIDPLAPASMLDYVDPDQQTIHVCEHCKSAVSKCAQCRKR